MVAWDWELLLFWNSVIDAILGNSLELGHGSMRWFGDWSLHCILFCNNFFVHHFCQSFSKMGLYEFHFLFFR